MNAKLQPYQDIFDIATSALAQMQEPVFPKKDRATTAFMIAFSLYGAPFDDWLHEIICDVARKSNGSVLMYRATFPTHVKGRAEACILKSVSGEQRFLLGPYSAPIFFLLKS